MEAPTRATKEEPSVRRNQEGMVMPRGKKQVRDTVLMMLLVKKGER